LKGDFKVKKALPLPLKITMEKLSDFFLAGWDYIFNLGFIIIASEVWEQYDINHLLY